MAAAPETKAATTTLPPPLRVGGRTAVVASLVGGVDSSLASPVGRSWHKISPAHHLLPLLPRDRYRRSTAPHPLAHRKSHQGVIPACHQERGGCRTASNRVRYRATGASLGGGMHQVGLAPFQLLQARGAYRESFPPATCHHHQERGLCCHHIASDRAEVLQR